MISIILLGLLIQTQFFFLTMGTKTNSILLLLIFSNCCVFLAHCQNENSTTPFVIAHMSNTPGSILWSLDQGVSAIELDLNFDQCGKLIDFGHEEPCHCTIACPFRKYCPSEFICSFHWSETNDTSPCGKRTKAKKMIDFLSSPQIINRLSFIYFDNRFQDTIPLFQAGQNLVSILNKKLMSGGYKGQVMINGFEFKNIEFLRGALDEARKTEFVDRYYYTLDANGRDVDDTRNALLTLRTPNIVFSHGGWKTYYAEMKDAVRKPGFLGRIVYTVDTKTEVETYLNQGINGIMTNVPSLALGIIAKRNNLTKEQFENVGRDAGFPRNNLTTLPPSPDPEFGWNCECKYHSKPKHKQPVNESSGPWTVLNFGLLDLEGGCVIEVPPPPGRACNCISIFWRCIGFNGNCKEPNSTECLVPSGSKSTCEFGRGNCNGYYC